MLHNIRLAKAEDSDALAALYAPYVTDSVASFETEPPDDAAMASRLKNISAFHPWLVLERSGQVVGYAYAAAHRERAAYRWSVDATVYVARGRHRQGIGRALYGALLPILRLQGFHSAFAGITLPNAGSVGLHEAFGFRPVGVYRDVGFKAGAWWDVGWWGLALAGAVPSPAEPKAFTPTLLAQVLAQGSPK
jgi:L-amino acid N-acyltransferase YncA